MTVVYFILHLSDMFGALPCARYWVEGNEQPYAWSSRSSHLTLACACTLTHTRSTLSSSGIYSAGILRTPM